MISHLFFAMTETLAPATRNGPRFRFGPHRVRFRPSAQCHACHYSRYYLTAFSFDPLHNATFPLHVTEPQCCASRKAWTTHWVSISQRSVSTLSAMPRLPRIHRIQTWTTRSVSTPSRSVSTLSKMPPKCHACHVFTFSRSVSTPGTRSVSTPSPLVIRSSLM